MATISALTWIPRGAAREKPVRFELTAEDVQNMQAANEQADTEEIMDHNNSDDGMDEKEENGDGSVEEVVGMDDNEDELPAELDMEHYDDDADQDLLDILDNDEEGDDEDGDAMSQLQVEEFGPGFLASQVVEDDDEEEDDRIQAGDSLIALAITDEDCSHLEIQVLTEDGSLYTHHDILLPDFPLCLAWLDCPPQQAADGGQRAVGSYCAVGSFSPAIEIWNLDVLDPLEPSAVLGGYLPRTAAPTAAFSSKNGKKGKKGGGGRLLQSEMEEPSEELRPGSHDGAVLSLAWNSSYRQALASGGADHMVKVWDVTTQQVQLNLAHHTDKVQALAWHGNSYGAVSSSPWLLASGSFDRHVFLTDCRSGGVALAAILASDIESLAWDPFASHLLWGSAEGGEIFCIDARRVGNSNASDRGSISDRGLLCSFPAHGKAVSSIAFSAAVPGMMASASLDKTVKIWDASVLQQQSLANDGVGAMVAEPPQLVGQKSLHVGKLFTLRFSGDDGFMLAAAGDKGQVAVWESDEMDTVRHNFEARALPVQSPYLAKVSSAADANAAEGSSSSNSNDSFFPPLQLSIPLVAALAAATANYEEETGKKKNKNKKRKNKNKNKNANQQQQQQHQQEMAATAMADDDSDDD